VLTGRLIDDEERLLMMMMICWNEFQEMDHISTSIRWIWMIFHRQCYFANHWFQRWWFRACDWFEMARESLFANARLCNHYKHLLLIIA
jgi:hypothetical protein